MNLNNLSYFKVIAETQNYRRAAEQLYITTSALSKAVSKLEYELGFPLFEKNGRNVVLTKFGETYYAYVLQAFENLKIGQAAVLKEMGEQAKKICIAGTYTMCMELLPPYIKEFNVNHPETSFSIAYDITSNILSKVLKEEFHLGFCGDYNVSSAEYNGIQRKLLRVEEMVIMAARDHPLAKERYINLSQLENESASIFCNINSGSSYNFWQLFKDADLTPQIKLEAMDDFTIVGLAAAGLGLALVPDNPALRVDNAVICRFRDSVPVRKLYMIWKKESYMPEVVKEFRDMVCDSVNK
ncbi:MAG: LysR family transcriptional regulator [Lachnospiraceae bacterium]